MLEKIKLLLNITDENKDALLTLLIQQAIDEAIEFTHNSDTSELESTIIKMVLFNYNRLGTAGIDAESYSGVSYTYAIDYPEGILRSLKNKRKLVTL